MPFVRVSSIFDIDANGIRWRVEAYPFYIFTRTSSLMGLRWDEVSDVRVSAVNEKPHVQIIPVKPTRFIKPISTKGLLRVRCKIDDEGNWLIAQPSVDEAERFAEICKAFCNEFLDTRAVGENRAERIVSIDPQRKEKGDSTGGMN
ncbi:MAG: hypothetical protein ACXVAK_15795 [Vulcanimicrobiaceae bacterium]